MPAASNAALAALAALFPVSQHTRARAYKCDREKARQVRQVRQVRHPTGLTPDWGDADLVEAAVLANIVAGEPDLVSGFPPELVYPGAIMELPLTDLLVIRGAGGRQLAEIEVPAFGPCMGARAISSKGAGPWLMLLRPPVRGAKARAKMRRKPIDPESIIKKRRNSVAAVLTPANAAPACPGFSPSYLNEEEGQKSGRSW